jgi:Domain of Unknown Function (DUF928)
MITTMSQKLWLLILTPTVGFTFLLPDKIAVAQVKNEPLPNTVGRPTRTIQSGTRIRLNLPPLGAPGRRIHDATRGLSCLARSQRLKALLPKSNVGLTTVANPTLYVFIPQNSAAEMELAIQDENDQIIYQQKYQPSIKAGIVGLNLPPNSLAVGKTYRWNLSIICDSEDRSLDQIIQGTIKRVENPSLMKKLEQATPYERLHLYAEAGIWYDALDTLARLRYSNPNNLQLKANWEDLLTAPGVELDKKLAQEPLQILENNKLN